MRNDQVITIGITAIILVALLIGRYVFDYVFPTTAPAFVPLIGAAYFSGLFAAIASAFLISIYEIMLFGNDLVRAGTVIVVVWVLALAMGHIRRKEREIQERLDKAGVVALENNIERMQHALRVIDRLIDTVSRDRNLDTVILAIDQVIGQETDKLSLDKMRRLRAMSNADYVDPEVVNMVVDVLIVDRLGKLRDLFANQVALAIGWQEMGREMFRVQVQHEREVRQRNTKTLG